MVIKVTECKTIFARYQDILAGGLDDSGMSINNVEKALERVNVRIRDSEDTFRPFGEVLDELSGKWNDLSQVEQSNIAKALAGVRQRENLLVLLGNYSTALKLQTVESNSSGLALQRYGIYMEGVEASANKFTATWEKMWQKTINSDAIKYFYDLGSSALGAIDSMGGLVPVIGLVVSALLIFKRAEIAVAFSGLKSQIFNVISAFKLMGTAALTTGATINLALGGIGLAFSVIALIVNAVQTSAESTEKNLESLKSEIDSVNSSLANSRNGLSELYKTQEEYEDLRTKAQSNTKLTADEEERFYSIQNRIKDILPQVNGYYNDQGNYILNLNTQMREYINLKQEEIDLDNRKAQQLAEKQINIQKDQFVSDAAGMQNIVSGRDEKLKLLQETDNPAVAEAIKKELPLFDQAIEDQRTKIDEDILNIEKSFANIPLSVRDSFLKSIDIADKEGKALHDKLTNVGFRDKTVEREPESGRYGTENKITDYKGISAESTIIKNRVANLKALKKATKDYGSGSAEELEALTKVIGENADAINFLAEDGSVDYAKLGKDTDAFYRNYLDKADELKTTLPQEAEALRGYVQDAKDAMDEVLVSGFQMSREELDTFSGEISSTMLNAATTAGIKLKAIDGTVLTSAENIKIALMNNFKNFDEFLKQLVAAGIPAAGELMAYFTQAAAWATGNSQYQPVAPPTGGGGGAPAGGSAVDAEKARIQGEIDALEQKKKALEDQLALYKKWIDRQKEALKVQKETADFTDELLDKERTLAELKARIALVELDDSEEAQANLIGLREDAAKQEKDIEKDKEDRVYDLKIQALDDAQTAFEDDIDRKIMGIERSIAAYNAEKNAVDNTTAAVDNETESIVAQGTQIAVIQPVVENFFLREDLLAGQVERSLQRLVDLWRKQGEEISQAKDVLQQYISLLNSAHMLEGAFGLTPALARLEGGEADGGPVSANKTYIVGEEGPEIFQPDTNGTIIPNDQILNNNPLKSIPSMFMNLPEITSKSSSNNINIDMPIHVSGNLDKSVLPDLEAIANKVVSKINKSLSLRGNLRTANQTIS